MTLLIVPPLCVRRDASGRPVLTQKFLDGMAEYARHWPGALAVLAEPSDSADDNLDQVALDVDELPFRLEVHPFSDLRAVRESFSHATLVLATLDYRQVTFWTMAQALGTPIAYVAEQSLQTRRQIIRAEVANPLRRLRRSMREMATERRFRAAIANSAGVQCNGTPTFHAYESISRNPLLFFDTRVDTEMVASERSLGDRAATLRSGTPLRLAFSGRLVAIKGVDHLPRVAAELRRLGVAFTLDIFGGGEEEPRLRREIARLSLAEFVRLRGVVDFRSELVPTVKREVDLFVCCHRQGDPSCTYLETMACGVPIIGYGNEAFAGLVKRCGVGWITPMDRPDALARRIADLSTHRQELVRAASAARAFALQHTFEKTMRNRVDHLLACARDA